MDKQPSPQPDQRQQDSRRRKLKGAGVFGCVLLAFAAAAIFGLRGGTEQSTVAATLTSAPGGPAFIPVSTVRDIAATPDSREVYVAHAGIVSVVETATNKVSDVISVPGQPGALTITPDGAFVFVATTTALVKIDTRSRTVVKQINHDYATARTIAVTPDGTRVYAAYSGLQRSWIAVLDTKTEAVTATLQFDPQTDEFVMGAGGRTLYLLRGREGRISVRDTVTETMAAEIRLDGSHTRLALTPDGRRLYSFEPKGSLTVIDTATNSIVARLRHTVGGRDIAAAPNGRYVYVVATVDPRGCVTVLDTTSGAVVEMIALPGPADRIAVTPDGRRLYVGTESDARMQVVDLSRYA
ncbi:YncE family protein [Nocardia sp. NPDC052566]|uniref:YncE family protein n=1 Tax=Nocardia sp. NPDC052566 TaxID=3364330 RepID=UPI0037CC4D70